MVAGKLRSIYYKYIRMRLSRKTLANLTFGLTCLWWCFVCLFVVPAAVFVTLGCDLTSTAWSSDKRIRFESYWRNIGENLRNSLKCDTTELDIYGKDLTIISAFFLMEKFQKGESFLSYQGPRLYYRWAKVLGRLENNLIFFTDSALFREMVLRSRRKLHHQTKVIFIGDKQDLKTFKLRKKIQEIFKDPSYPKYHPNTVNPDYVCMQHVKYELVQEAILRRNVTTKYLGWMDIGYFRDIYHLDMHFFLRIPCDFNQDKIAFNLVVKSVSLATAPYDIMRGNMVWVGGGLFFGNKHILLQFSEQYQRALSIFLGQNLANTDQQVLFSMYSDIGRDIVKPSVEIQLYSRKSEDDVNIWFYLGYVCFVIVQNVTAQI